MMTAHESRTIERVLLWIADAAIALYISVSLFQMILLEAQHKGVIQPRRIPVVAVGACLMSLILTWLFVRSLTDVYARTGRRNPTWGRSHRLYLAAIIVFFVGAVAILYKTSPELGIRPSITYGAALFVCANVAVWIVLTRKRRRRR